MIRIISFLLISTVCFAQKPVFVTAKATNATVYSQGVELTHKFDAKLLKGTSEIVVKNVAEQLNENTIQIAVPDGVTILSTQFTTNYISEYDIDDSNPQIKQVKDSIDLFSNKLTQLKNEANSIKETIKLLDNNKTVYGTNAGLNIQDLKTMVEYYKTKRTDLSNELNLVEKKQEEISKQLTTLNAKLDWRKKNDVDFSNGKLILQVMSDHAKNANFKISYLSNYASWSPFYDLKAKNTSAPINLIYKAQIKQHTGLDWEKINLTLSSGLPNQNNEAPILNAWFLGFHEYVSVGYANVLSNTVNRKEKKEYASAVETINEEGLDDYVEVSQNQLNVSFDIDVPYNILSNNKAHSVALKNLSLAANYNHYSVPKLDTNTYLLAFIEDYSQYNLLPGQANVIFEGMYVGKTYINPNKTDESLRLSLGKDKNVSVKREKVVDKSGTKFLSSYKKQTFTFDLIVKNNKNEKIELILKDQFPLSTDESIELEWLDKSGGEVNKETGVITWNLSLKPNESIKKRIQYTVKYPKKKNIGNL